jgi:hypothetical protein
MPAVAWNQPTAGNAGGKFEETTLGSAHIDSAGMKISSGNWIATARRPSSLRAVPSRSPVVRILPG